MSENAQLSNLPTELLLLVGGFLSAKDLSSFSRLNRQFHRQFFQILFDLTIAHKFDPKRPKLCCMDLLHHAIKHDSKSIVQYLIYSPYQVDLNGLVLIAKGDLPICCPSYFKFLHLALLVDAPKVAVMLIKNGAVIGSETDVFPDLTFLYFALLKSLAGAPKELDSTLHLACSHALPRTTRFLLTRGANVNTTNKYGIAPIHTALMRRCPWSDFEFVANHLSIEYKNEILRRDSAILQTIAVLLDLGADENLPSQTSRTHECDPKCWRSIDCDHPGQTPLHLASATGVYDIVSRLLDAGANPNLLNGQGYTALYVAIVQGHKNIACRILKACDDPINPIVCILDDMTALHAACRFSFAEMVEELLDGGADANVIDSYGRTPLHDVFVWARLDREKAVAQTLRHLVKFGADVDPLLHLNKLGGNWVDSILEAVIAQEQVEEQALELTTKVKLNQTIASAAGIWPEVETSQLADNLKTLTIKPKSALEFEEPIKAFPILNDTSRASVEDPTAGPLSVESAQFWGGLKDQIGGAGKEASIPSPVNVEATQFWSGSRGRSGSAKNEIATGSNKNSEGLGPGRIGAKTGRDRNKQKWTPLQL